MREALNGLLDGGQGASLLDRIMQPPPPAPVFPDLDDPVAGQGDRERRGRDLQRASAADAARPWFEDWVPRFERSILDAMAGADAAASAELAAQVRVLRHMKQCFRQDLRTGDRAKQQQQEHEDG
jgi:hypothetical protein